MATSLILDSALNRPSFRELTQSELDWVNGGDWVVDILTGVGMEAGAAYQAAGIITGAAEVSGLALGSTAVLAMAGAIMIGYGAYEAYNWYYGSNGS